MHLIPSYIPSYQDQDMASKISHLHQNGYLPERDGGRWDGYLPGLSDDLLKIFQKKVCICYFFK